MAHYDGMREATEAGNESQRRARRKELDAVAYKTPREALDGIGKMGRRATDKEVVQWLADLQAWGGDLDADDAYTLASARAVITRLREEVVDLIDTVEACLVAAGAPKDIDEMEKQVSAAGTKPSHYVRQQIRRLTKELQQRDRFLDQRIDILTHKMQRSLQGSFHEEDLREQRDELTVVKTENKRIQEHLKKAQ